MSQPWVYLGVLYDILLSSLRIAGQALGEQIRGAVYEATAESIRKLDPDRHFVSKPG